VLALNMIDVAEKQGLRLDVPRLEKQLGIPVVPIQANAGKGLERLKEVIAAVVREGVNGRPHVRFPDAFEQEVAALREALGGEVPEYLVRRLLLDVGGYTESRLARHSPLITHRSPLTPLVQPARQRLAAAGCPVPAVEARARYGWVREVTAGCVQRPARRPVTWTDRLDRVLTHRVWGVFVFLALMFVVFQSIFLWATPLMDLIKAGKGVLGDC